MSGRAWLIGAACLAAAPVLAQQAGPVDRASVLAERSSLDNGSPDWHALTLTVGRHWSARRLLEVELTEARRFGQQDTEVAVAGALALGERLTGTLRASHSPTHRVLARDGLAAGLQFEFRPAWLLHGTFRRTRYDATAVEQGSLMVEHYFGAWSAAAAVHSARAFAQRSEAGELRLAYYYGHDSSVGLFAARGDEVAQVGAGALAVARVHALAVTGRHHLTGPWALRWGVHRVRQGAFYTRSGVSIGVQASF